MSYFGATSEPRKRPEKCKVRKKMSKAEMQLAIIKKKQCDAKALRIVEQLLEPNINAEWLLQNLKYINKSHLEDAIEERAIVKLCGYVLCSNPLTIVISQQYHISMKKNKVYDVSRRKNFCSSRCYAASSFILEQMLTSPLWLRDKEEIPNFQLLRCDAIMKGSPGDEVVMAEIDVTLDDKGGPCNEKQDVADSDESVNKARDGEGRLDAKTVKEIKEDKEELESQERSIKDFNETDFNKPRTESESDKDLRILDNLNLTTDIGDEQMEENRNISEDVNINEQKLLNSTAGNKIPTRDTGLSLNRETKSCKERLDVKDNQKESLNPSECKDNKIMVNLVEKKENEVLAEHNNQKLTIGSDVLEKATVTENNLKTNKELEAKNGLELFEYLELQDNSRNENKNDTNECKVGNTVVCEKNSNLIENITDVAEEMNKSTSMEQRTKSTKSKRTMIDDEKMKKERSKASGAIISGFTVALRVENSVKEWITEDTLCLLLGEAEEKQTLLENINRYDKYLQLCKKLNKLQLDDGREDRVDLLRDNLKPLPGLSELREEGKKMELKVRAFYAGRTTHSTEEANSGTNTKEDLNSVIPLTESHAPKALRRRIFLDKLNKILPDVLRALTGNVQSYFISEYTHNGEKCALIKALVSTFSLSPSNIVFKNAEWVLVGLIFTKLLSIIDHQLRTLLQTKQASMYTSMILMSYKLDSHYLDRLIIELTNNPNIFDTERNAIL